jgi:hypothetical protein
MGGLGNNLFQLFVKYLLEQKGYDVQLVVTLVKRNWLTQIARWSIHNSSYTVFLDNKKTYDHSPLIALYALVIKKMKLHSKFVCFWRDDEMLSKSTHLFGYFQSKFFLENYRKEFSEFCRKTYQALNHDSKIGCVVHYRKGDSRLARIFESYYHQVYEMTMHEDRVTVVTDSITEANEFFKGNSNVNILCNTNPIDDFGILACARRLYCAPSTFSWWAAQISIEAELIVMPMFFMEKLGNYSTVKTKLLA